MVYNPHAVDATCMQHVIGLFQLKSHFNYVYHYIINLRLIEREKLDRRRAEAAYFQYAVLRVASWYPHLFNLFKLPLHSKHVTILSDVTEVYHGAFMELYAGIYSIHWLTHVMQLDNGNSQASLARARYKPNNQPYAAPTHWWCLYNTSGKIISVK